jgi:hypothetical protein
MQSLSVEREAGCAAGNLQRTDCKASGSSHPAQSCCNIGKPSAAIDPWHAFQVRDANQEPWASFFITSYRIPAPRPICSGVEYSLSLWLMPPTEGTKIIEVGATVLMFTAS